MAPNHKTSGPAVPPDGMRIQDKFAASPLRRGLPGASSFGGDQFAGILPRPLSHETLHPLLQIKPARAIARIGLEWLGIFTAIALSQAYFHWALYLVTVLWIGARQHALLTLMHEGAHYHLLRHRRLNDLVSEVLLAWPMFVTMRNFRVVHFTHHRHANSKADPDWMRKVNGPKPHEWRFPMRARSLGWVLFKDAIGLDSRQQWHLFYGLGRPEAGWRRLPRNAFDWARVAFYGSTLALIIYLQIWQAFFLYWVIPLVTWLTVILRMRTIAEHFGLRRDHPYTQARTTYPTPMASLFLVSVNLCYHIDHHLYPAVPYYHLPKLHAALLEDPEFQQKAHITKSYWAMLKECTDFRMSEQPVSSPGVIARPAQRPLQGRLLYEYTFEFANDCGQAADDFTASVADGAKNSGCFESVDLHRSGPSIFRIRCIANGHGEVDRYLSHSLPLQLEHFKTAFPQGSRILRSVRNMT